MLLGTDYLTDSETLCNSGVCIMYPALTETVAYPSEGTGICKQTFWKEPRYAHNLLTTQCPLDFESDPLAEVSDRGAAQWVLGSSSILSATQAHVWHGS